MNRQPHGPLLDIESPLGILRLEAANDALTALRFLEDDRPEQSARGIQPPEVLERAARQLQEYFDGKRDTFDLPTAPAGTSFEQAVWKRLLHIPCGSSCSYGEIARQLGDPNKVRAVGRANGRNPIPIIIPCHRVVGSDRKLTGYSGGVHRKRWLLRHEGVILI